MTKSIRIRRSLIGAGISLAALAAALPVAAQTIPTRDGQAPTGSGNETVPLGAAPAADSATGTDAGATNIGDIIVTAQRQSESLQKVPISLSAFDAKALAALQINTASDLQLSIPNVTFTKANFGNASFTIRGVGDLCVGTSCDSATAIHLNDMPLQQSRLFETDYFDMERIEVLRGPQGTLFGRNATAGVVNFITARPNLKRIEASVSGEYGNYSSGKVTAMLNLPITDWLGIRVAGNYLNRDGFTQNLYDNSRIDGRDLYSLRGTIRFQPTPTTTLDIIGSYFHERDDRLRFQKQGCARDDTGILGCRPDGLGNGTVNSLATFGSILASRQFLTIATGSALIGSTGIDSLYGADPLYQGVTTPSDIRTVSTNYRPHYFAENLVIQAKLQQEIGPHLTLNVTGGYTRDATDQRAGFDLAVANSLVGNAGIATLAGLAAAPGAAFGGSNPFTPAAAALFPNGTGGGFCVSNPNHNLTGIYGGYVASCAQSGDEFDSSSSVGKEYSIEAHLDSKFDGSFNFLIGGIYLDNKVTSDYYVSAFSLDYVAGVLGAATTLGQRAAGNTSYPNVFLAPPFYDSEIASFRLKSYGIFGETYFQATNTLKFTAGLRYSNDQKRQIGRNLTISFPVPYGTTVADQSPYAGSYDADASQAGFQPYADTRTSSSALTGRFVIDWQATPNNLFYASYSRGYKSGGINPTVPAALQIPATFAPEHINAYEIGTKNTLLGGTLRLNGSLFYYDYKNLQISRLAARTAINDNSNAQIYGAEAEAVISPTRDFQVDLTASYLHTKVTDLSILDPRDPSGGRSDAVIIKDITSGSNCVVVPGAGGNAVGANALVAAVNASLGLQAPVAVPGTNTTGAFSICNSLQGTLANPPTALRALLMTPTGTLPYSVSDGIARNLSGNQLPQSPMYKFSAGAQYTERLGNGWSLVPRADLLYTGGFYARVFNDSADRVQGYAVVNAQIQLNGPDARWFVRGFVQNLTDNNAVTGEFLADQSVGLFTNLFTLDPRRYGIGAGIRF